MGQSRVLRVKKKIPGVYFFCNPSWAGLTNYVIGHMSKYGNMMSSLSSLSSPGRCRCLASFTNPVPRQHVSNTGHMILYGHFQVSHVIFWLFMYLPIVSCKITPCLVHQSHSVCIINSFNNSVMLISLQNNVSMHSSPQDTLVPWFEDWIWLIQRGVQLFFPSYRLD